MSRDYGRATLESIPALTAALLQTGRSAAYPGTNGTSGCAIFAAESVQYGVAANTGRAAPAQYPVPTPDCGFLPGGSVYFFTLNV